MFQKDEVDSLGASKDEVDNFGAAKGEVDNLGASEDEVDSLVCRSEPGGGKNSGAARAKFRRI